MRDIKRVFLFVLDSLGIGALPDAAVYGDEGSNTLKSVAESPFFHAPNLGGMGLFEIDGALGGVKTGNPEAVVARLKEMSAGKDTTTGHWEFMGTVLEKPFITYENGFDAETVNALTRLTNREFICNKPYSGTAVIKDYGREHMQTGKLILYTSADSVMQIAAHEKKVPISELYEVCEKARALMTGERAVGRIIARPFDGEYPFFRTANRKDFSLKPPRNHLDDIAESGLEVVAVGKISDIYAGQAITRSIHTSGNAEGFERVEDLLDQDFPGLCFVNFVDFDMLYGHRNDVDGYAKAVSAFDEFLGGFLKRMKESDALIIAADHGCDPKTPSTDHSREYVPYLCYYRGIEGKNLGTLDGLGFVGKTVKELLKVK